MEKNILKKAEKELAELKEKFNSISTKIKETAGPKVQVWLFQTKYKIENLEEKIKDLKAGKIRTDKLPLESVDIKKRIAGLENSLGKTIKGKEQIWL